MLGTAQPFRFLRAKGRGDGAVRPSQAPFRGLVYGPAPRRCHREKAALSFDQDVARVGGGRRDDGDPAGLSGCRLPARPLCQGPRLTKSTTSEKEPDRPIAGGWQLIWPGDGGPGIRERSDQLRREGISHRSLLRYYDPPAPVAKRSRRRDRAVPQSPPRALLYRGATALTIRAIALE